jgi:hypothetical protein
MLVGYDDGTIKSHYAIQHEGKLWLVTAWLIDHSTQVATPERMIRVDSFQKTDPGERFDYVNVQLPKAVVDGISQEAQGYEVRSLPDSPRFSRSDLKTLPPVV